MLRRILTVLTGLIVGYASVHILVKVIKDISTISNKNIGTRQKFGPPLTYNVDNQAIIPPFSLKKKKKKKKKRLF